MRKPKSHLHAGDTPIPHINFCGEEIHSQVILVIPVSKRHVTVSVWLGLSKTLFV